ncbi:MAG: hypothetical protein KDL31_04430 [Kiritimatiellae bacterium]|nr:hypothetical protein [Kiritimatiellia bacterium]
MAWRLKHSVIRGEFSNREENRITGRLWLVDRDEVITMDLEGNFLRDLAGCQITFTNPEPTPGEDTGLHACQVGVSGDMTASRKVRVMDLPPEEIVLEQMPLVPDRSQPTRYANALYLEWFSDYDGRVVIESTDFSISVSEPAWHMTSEEEAEQEESNREAFRAWLEHLSEMDPDQPAPPLDYEQPLDEFGWERLMRESDRKTERLGEVLEKYHGHPDSEKLIAREMGWTWLEEELEAQERGVYDEEDDEDDPREDDDLIGDEMDFDWPEPDPLKEGIDWVRDENGDVHHPLALRAMKLGLQLWHACDQLGVLNDSRESVVQNMVIQVQICSAKLAGALNNLAYDDDQDNGFIVAALKRSVNYLHTALNLSQQVESKQLLPPEILNDYRGEMFRIREEITDLMRHYRSRLGH